MDAPTSSTPQPGQRALAAIVFTDVVSFSARMQADEEATLRLLQRDFAAMRGLCAQHQGSVLKTTGDGLLMFFNSAVQAVACALAVQRHFAAQAKEPGALVHRVGIHLGDVFVSEQDVMGDGVNIAARLQAEAEPGGICISQTVYDVVKNKLALHVTRLGPRELKNISESIPIYRLLLEAQAAGGSAPPLPEPAAPAPGPVAATAAAAATAGRSLRSLAAARWLWVALAAAAVVALAALVFAQARARRQLAQERAAAEAARAALAAAFAQSAQAAASDAAEFDAAAATLGHQMQVYRRQFIERYDFSGLAAAVRRDLAAGTVPAGARALARSADQLAALHAWTVGQLQRYNGNRPLAVRELAGTAPKEHDLYAGQDRQLYFVEGGAVRRRPWNDVKPAIFGAAIVAVLLQAPAPPPRDVLQGALGYARLFNLPEMTEALRSRRPAARAGQ